MVENDERRVRIVLYGTFEIVCSSEKCNSSAIVICVQPDLTYDMHITYHMQLATANDGLRTMLSLEFELRLIRGLF